ncbi:MAG TPA: hypothetical protein VFE50_25390 [Cyclobacteriaceae bacterium]|nr:hypothetical protein [Cyclobacteriaceae bacterium]
MPLRRSVILTCLCLAAFACENEPYQYPPLGVISLTNHVSNQTNTYRYRKQHIYTYQVTSGADVWTTMKFTYAFDQLLYIVRDSSAASRTVSTFYHDGKTTKDTTRFEEGAIAKTVSARSVTDDDEGNPILIYQISWNDDGTTTENGAELVWEDGNVVKLTTYTIVAGEKTLVKELTIGHDDQSCVYMRDPDYLYTLSFKDLFWLSKNNPVSFNDGSGDKKYTYWYNKLGYPSNFKNELGTLFGANYTQVR